MLLLQGRFEEARREADFAQRAYRDVGDRHMMAELEAVRGDIARFEERIDDAVAMHRAGYEGKLALGDQAFASTSAVEYSRALATSGQLDEALRMADIALATSAHDDIASQGGGRSAKANALSLMGRHDEAVAVGREGVAIMGGTDYLYFWGECEVDLAWVLWRAGQRAEALDHAETALDLYQQKGATLLAERTRTQIAAWEAAGQ
jgi:tetratricopeptide (TPR) repeat protein